MIRIDKQSPLPIYEQFVSQMEILIATGAIDASTPLPSIRTLSRELSVNPNTLQKAYGILEERGLCYTVPGSGRMLTERAKALATAQQRAALSEIEQLCQKLKAFSVSEEEILSVVHAVYERGAAR